MLLNRFVSRPSLFSRVALSNTIYATPKFLNSARFFSAESAKSDPTLLGRLTINELPVSSALKDSLKRQFQFSDLTLVQEKAIPAVLNAEDTRDVIVQSKTGSGKTLAFLIPIVEAVLRARKNGGSPKIRGLILSPTRELAIQIEEVLRKLIYPLGRGFITQDLMMGGVSVSNEEKKLIKWLKGIEVPDILVATPGRLLMHLEAMPEFSLAFQSLQHFVLDEADTLIDIGFMDDIQRIAHFLPKDRKTMFFSATMKRKANELAQGVLKKERLFITNDESAAIPALKQRVWEIDSNMRWASYIRLILDNPTKKMIFFFETKKAVDLFSSLLKHYDVNHIALHGGKDQKSRTNLFFRFSKDERSRVLICTDVAARGLDFPDVDVVVQADLPVGSSDFSNYFHRSGRTARAGKEGIALLPLSTKEKGYVLPVLRTYLNAHYKEEVKMVPITEEDGIKLSGDIKNIHDEMNNMCANNIDFRLEARGLARMFEGVFAKFNALFLKGKRVYEVDELAKQMQMSVNSSLGVNTAFAGGLEKGMTKEETRFVRYDKPSEFKDGKGRDRHKRLSVSLDNYDTGKNYRNNRSFEEEFKPRYNIGNAGRGERRSNETRVGRSNEYARMSKPMRRERFNFEDDDEDDFLNVKSKH